MASGRVACRLACLVVILALLMGALMPAAVEAQAPAPAPALSNDGHAIDQGIAYFLLLLALIFTYLIPLDAFQGFF